MDVAVPSSPAANLEWAKHFVAKMSNEQRQLLQQMYIADQEKKKKAREEELAKQQQAILDSLTRQIPITVDVVRATTPPESQASSSSSVVSCYGEEDHITVKDAVMGKLKNASRCVPNGSPKPYRPRTTRERVLFDSHLYVFDKCSYDSKKKFYRCEKKNTCPARLHTPFDSPRVIHKVQVHNHPPPATHDLSHWDIDYGKMRSGFIYLLVPKQSQGQAPSRANQMPHSLLLTPKSDFDGDRSEKSVTPTPMDFLTKLANQLDDKKVVSVKLPAKFSNLNQSEVFEIELALTKFLLSQHDLRNEFINYLTNIPTFFPNAPKNELILFVADFSVPDAPFHMLTVKERNEKSIRAAIMQHLKQVSTRALMVNVCARINVPLSQQMIDEWKTEEFIRLDFSKPNAWKVHRITKLHE
ncbi:hypothetical protein CRE_12403 [Caenorhabditis remanei]|uniref:FLYWCH-type domain-containing protein n=1 Tax=Caenorhabditis remanei TaxID=31234 RepID=E3NNV2_CAERE|nr:hypothetical protein CRE_12403 [Caenorhabditis remanei]